MTSLLAERIIGLTILWLGMPSLLMAAERDRNALAERVTVLQYAVEACFGTPHRVPDPIIRRAW